MTNQPAPDLSHIPHKDLASDLVDAIEDVALCEFCLDAKIFAYPSGDTWPRLKSGHIQIEMITAELKRRRTAELLSGEMLIAPALQAGAE